MKAPVAQRDARIDFERLFALAPNPYMILDRAFRYVAANEAYLRVTASRLEDLLGRNIFEVFPHDPADPGNENAARLRASFERVLRERVPDTLALIPYRVPRHTPEGIVVEERFWSATHLPLLGDDGEVAFILQHTEDVTELQRLKSAVEQGTGGLVRLENAVLRRAEDVQQLHQRVDAERLRLLSLFHQAPGFVAFLRGPEHRFDLVNVAYQQLVGHRDIVGKSVREALPELVGQGFYELLDGVYRSGEPYVGRALKVKLQRHPGAALEDVYVDFIYQPVRGPDGQVTGIFVQGNDITEQKEMEAERRAAEDALRVSEERLRRVVEASGAGTWETSMPARETKADARLLSMFGFPVDAPVGGFDLRSRVHPQDLERVDRALDAALRGEGNGQYALEYRVTLPDGTERWIDGRGQVFFAADGSPLRIVGTAVDITSRKRVEEDLLQRAEFEQQLIGIVSHDLRNPINAILLSGGALVKRESLSERAAKNAARVVASAERANRLIRDLLDFTQARIGNGLPISRRRVDFHLVAGQAIEEVQVTFPERDVVFEQFGDGTGELDPERVGQVVQNLLTNAFRYSPPGSVVRVTTRAEDGHVAVEVHNEGEPIPEEILPRLFHAMKRGAEQVDRATRSVGLGLFIVDQIVRAHGGTVQVTSSREAGTVFKVRFPRGLS